MSVYLAEVAAVSDFGSELNTALTTSVNPNTIGTQFIQILPWVGLMVIVAFVMYEGKKLIKGSAKAKVRL